MSLSSNNDLKNSFQCFTHRIRNDTDWVNVKRSIIRAPQIIKQKMKGSDHSPVDEEFDAVYERFITIDNALHVLERELQNYVLNSKNLMVYASALCEGFGEVFDPNLESEGTATLADNYHTLTTRVGLGYEKFTAAAKFSKKLSDIQAKAEPNLVLILDNVRDPVSKLLVFTKEVKRYIKEREFANLDVNKYADHIASLSAKDKTTLTLKQEQNLIRYEKSLELSRLKFEQINDTLKKDLLRFSNLVDEIVMPLLTELYFLQLTVLYQMLDVGAVADDVYRLGSKEANMGPSEFALHILDVHHRSQEVAREKLSQLEITKSSLERSLSSLLPVSDGERYDGVSLARTEFLYCTANYSFEGQQEGDLSFEKGDQILIFDQSTMGGDWWRGELNGVRGIFPKNYVIIRRLHEDGL